MLPHPVPSVPQKGEFRPGQQWFTPRRASSHTRRRCVRLSSIAQYSTLLPPVKDKHAKKRLLQEPFISEMARVTALGGTATIVTDHPGYTAQISDAMVANASWSPLFEPPYYVKEWENYGSSYFGELWREQGIPIHYLQFCKEGR